MKEKNRRENLLGDGGQKIVDKSHVFCAESCRQTHRNIPATAQKKSTGYARYSIENWRNPIKYLLKVNYIQTFYLCVLDSLWPCARQTRQCLAQCNTFLADGCIDAISLQHFLRCLWCQPASTFYRAGSFHCSASHVRINLPFRLPRSGCFFSLPFSNRLHWLQCNIWNAGNDKLCSH